MAGKRGAFEQPGVENPATYVLRRANGKVSVMITLDRDDFPAGLRSRIVRLLVRACLDRVDPPLRLVVGDAPPPRPAPLAVARDPGESPA